VINGRWQNDPMNEGWQRDVLGEGYEQLTLPLGSDDEGEVVATLVRYTPPWELADLRRGPAEDVDVLYVHGWSDYFFQTELAEFWHRMGARFHALDLRKYGRSLRPGQTPGYVTDLARYDEDIAAALDAIAAEHRRPRRLVLMGHSTGGLTLSLWAARHPKKAVALILNSPWLEFQARAVGRQAIAPWLMLRARFDPLGSMHSVDPGFYTRTVSATMEGAWDYDLTWRPERGFPAHPAWLAAILIGHRAVEKGLHLPIPVLTLLSSRSVLLPWWSDEMRTADVALDVEGIAQRTLGLGPLVTIARIEGAVHDVVLSAPDVRAHAYGEIERWLHGYVA
jgi:alpha-beta hydrolase superfamily lysophospholipase